eukprot:TRINITY_DN23457_c0_g2_i2.p1 TRINITY_DN23457_c0_g2~~TRINITY_DN23457_c0_g2_i2.p1  ORF type:complete len:532 (-),score=214.85 TRINITY_DN23457_c0_g2_i2:45-1640(-)
MVESHSAELAARGVQSDAELALLKAREAKLEDKHREAMEELAELRRKVQEQASVVRVLGTQESEALRKLKIADELAARVEAVEAELADKEAIGKEAVAKMEAAEEERSRTADEVADLQEQLRASSKALETVMQEGSNDATHVEMLQEELKQAAAKRVQAVAAAEEAVKAKVARLEAELKQAVRERDEAESAADKAAKLVHGAQTSQQQLDQVARDRDKVLAATKVMATELEQSNQAFEKASAELDEKLVQNNLLQSQLGQMELELEQVKKNTTVETSASSQAAHELQEQLAAVLSAKQTLESEVVGLRVEKAGLKRDAGEVDVLRMHLMEMAAVEEALRRDAEQQAEQHQEEMAEIRGKLELSETGRIEREAEAHELSAMHHHAVESARELAAQVEILSPSPATMAETPETAAQRLAIWRASQPLSSATAAQVASIAHHSAVLRSQQVAEDPMMAMMQSSPQLVPLPTATAAQVATIVHHNAVLRSQHAVQDEMVAAQHLERELMQQAPTGFEQIGIFNGQSPQIGVPNLQ